ncbi:hypothetical protein EYF80_034875 [Liparis tanakae]|uniref:Uncharacterized protein n=1 Tax=Liparis tanakae TaxID=230148 RepID=A0A4Z2GNY3_9TELE|nr:hypothetical protein EYF80_034875 [Liparis tanakae]
MEKYEKQQSSQAGFKPGTLWICKVGGAKQLGINNKKRAQNTVTLKAVRLSIILVTLSSLTVSVNAGQGDEWENLDRLENSGWLHWEHTYIPARGH